MLAAEECSPVAHNRHIARRSDEDWSIWDILKNIVRDRYLLLVLKG